jgi:hypothetical protein
MNDFDDLFGSKQYHVLKLEERRVYELLAAAAEKRRLYQGLEREYAGILDRVSRDISSAEGELSLTPEEATAKTSIMTQRLNEVEGKINSAREELHTLKLRNRLGEYACAGYLALRDKVRERLVKLVEEKEWYAIGLAVLRRAEASAGKIADIHEPLVDPATQVKPEKPSTSRSEQDKAPPLLEANNAPTLYAVDKPGNRDDRGRGDHPSEGRGDHRVRTVPKNNEDSFSTDETVHLPKELVGSDPERLLTPALHIKSSQGWERYPLKKPEVAIGNIRNPENDIALYDPETSRRHAKVIRDTVTEEWFFVDIGSTNGSAVNGEEVAARNPVKLKNNDIIRVGGAKIVVYLP